MREPLWPDAIGRLVRREDLPIAVVEQAMTAILSGEATDAQITAMEALLHAALAAGAIGFSSSQAPTHNDGRCAIVSRRSQTGGFIDGVCRHRRAAQTRTRHGSRSG